MKTKKVSIYAKTLERMEREVNRATNNVQMLQKLYLETVKTKENK